MSQVQPLFPFIAESSADRFLAHGDVMSLVPTIPGEAESVRYRISDCGETNLKADPQEICGNAPIARLFLGQPTGHTAHVMRKGVRVQMMLDDIE